MQNVTIVTCHMVRVRAKIEGWRKNMNFFETGPHLPFQGKRETDSADRLVWSTSQTDDGPNGASRGSFVPATSELLQSASEAAATRKI